MAQISTQYAFRAQKTMGLVGGGPEYLPVEGFVAPEASARTYKYSTDGRLFAVVVPSGVRIHLAESAQLLQELSLPNIVEINFSPRGTYISTWERPVKLEDGSQHKNLRIFSVSTGEQLTSFSQKSQEGWDVQYTISESHAVRLVSQEVQVYSPSDWSAGIVSKLKVEGSTSVSLSPGLNPSLAVFVAEKKGAPASVKIYGLLALGGAPTCQKNFYKADRCQIKWNTLGTQVLVFTITDVDNSNKSYYGETGLYLLSAAGNFDCRVTTTDKEGPIHDFTWSPNSKEFSVIYGYMPAKAVLFDQRVRVLHDFGTGFYNTVLFNPQGRLLLLAGFGNLAGKVAIYDRRTLSSVTTIDASNTSYCEWSPDGRFLLTATLSPRLRVDNGIKIWHCSGPLLHVQPAEELYQAGWRPAPVDAAPPFGQALPQAPAPAQSVSQNATSAKPPPAKLGAYRPPGARGTVSSSVYKREEEGGPPNSLAPPTPPGAMSPNGRYSRSPMRGAKRHIPGAAASPSPTPDRNDQKARKRKGGKKDGPGNGPGANGASGASTPTNGAQTPVPAGNGEVEEKRGRPPMEIRISSVGSPLAGAVSGGESVPPTPGDGLDPAGKKLRNLTKKLKAIDELKEKASRGERLEATQLKKIESEAEIRKELAGLAI